MIEYGDEVRYCRTGEVGKVIGFRRYENLFLVKFDMDHEHWLAGSTLTKEKGGIDRNDNQ